MGWRQPAASSSRTDRLEVRLPADGDRARFVALFRDAEFMAFSAGVLDRVAAERRFDEMLVRSAEVPFAKQPVIERDSGVIVGYAGVDRFHFEGEERLEFGYRLIPAARGKGYATEASRLVLHKADAVFAGEILAMIDPTNTASRNVATKLGFAFWKQATVSGYLDDIYRLQVRGPSEGQMI